MYSALNFCHCLAYRDQFRREGK